ncbi:MAG: hypothetical protein V9F01_04775 [Chitinophagaceae bacterium]
MYRQSCIRLFVVLEDPVAVFASPKSHLILLYPAALVENVMVNGVQGLQVYEKSFLKEQGG